MDKGPFYFVGKGLASKSLYLRALLVQSYFPSFQIRTEPDRDPNFNIEGSLIEQGREQGLPHSEVSLSTQWDVHYMKQALWQLQEWGGNHKEVLTLDCGLSGALLRFLALRVARESGDFVLKGQARLFKRPMRELLSILGQLSCEVEGHSNCLHIKSRGWRPTGDAVTAVAHRSSQFVSALLLNSWILPFDLYLSIEGTPVSSSYLQMTLSFLRSLGMQIIPKGGDGPLDARIPKDKICKEYYIPKGQKPNKWFYEVEPDMGCLFALSAMTLGGGEVVFQDWPEQSLQPDFVFPTLLQKMGFHIYPSCLKIHASHLVLRRETPPYSQEFPEAEPSRQVLPAPNQFGLKKNKSLLKVRGGQDISPITYNMRDCPDLFPVLSAICAFSEGESRLYGAPHLCYKESHRVQKTAELLKKVGKTVRILKDGISISGPLPNPKIQPFTFDPDQDHRMAMSAGVLKKAGLPIRILTPEVVNKSFPHFWSITHIDPLKW